MDPGDIPSSVTKHIYNAHSVGDTFYPAAMSQNDAAKMLAQFWPAIAGHFAQLLLDRNPDRDADFSAGVDWAADTIRNES